MKNNLFHVKLIEEISTKIPQKQKMVNVLTEMLDIEREAVYRRLRGEVPFSFSEVAIISRKLSLSIDELVDANTKDVSPFRLRLMEFSEPGDRDFQVVEQLTRFIDFINNPDTEGCESTNLLPRGLCFMYESLIRFYTLKWEYQYSDPYRVRKYSDISITPKMKLYYKGYVQASHKLGQTCYILDFKLFEYLANDLTYFRGINLLTDEELIQIKTDLMRLLDYFEEMTMTGQYKDTGNKVKVYISNLNFDTSYSYLKTATYHISFIKAFILNTVMSFDKKTFEKTKNWINAQIKSSTLITESGEMDRIRFFHTQREIVRGI